MITLQKINALEPDRVLECVGEDSGDTFRVLVQHTSPSHYEAIGQVTLHNATVSYPCSGPMTADLLYKWLDTFLAKWPSGKTATWSEHSLDGKVSQFIKQVREASKV